MLRLAPLLQSPAALIVKAMVREKATKKSQARPTKKRKKVILKKVNKVMIKKAVQKQPQELALKKTKVQPLHSEEETEVDGVEAKAEEETAMAMMVMSLFTEELPLPKQLPQELHS